MGAVIIDYSRTSFHRAHRGALKDVRPEDLASIAAKSVVEKTNVKVDDIEDLLLGCAYPEGVQGLNLGRITTYLSNLPPSIPGATTNRLCGSSMQTIHTAAGSISMGSGELFLCGGVETMSLVHPGLEESYPQAYINMGITAENLATSHQISREDQELFAFNSHTKALSAQSNGFFQDEIVVVGTPTGAVSIDGCMRPPNLEKMATLKPAFLPTGSVTAATSSPLTDGAAFTLVGSDKYSEENSLPAIAEIVSTAVAGVPPEIMGIGPVPATKKALERAGLTLEEIDVIELNEAFSSQSLAVCKDLSLSPDDSRINIDGGALAIGHPLGASGCRITGKTANLLQRTGGEYGLATMCIGGGMGIATILRKL